MMIETERHQVRGKIDQHHIMHHREEWSLRNESLYIRETHSLIPALERSVHDEIHRECPAIPLLGCYALQQVVKNFEPTQDTIETVERLMRAIEQAGNHYKTHPVQRELGQLAIEALEIEIPYLEEGIILPRRSQYIT